MLLVVRPLPASVAEKLRVFADALGVDDDMISVARKYADGAEDLAAGDFSRNGYLGDFEETVLVTEQGAELITDAPIRRW